MSTFMVGAGKVAARVGSGFLSRGTGEVMVRLFPGTDIHVVMQQAAAVHLLRLLERYNWALSESPKYVSRWRKFWPVVSPLERTMVVMFVRASNFGQFRGSVCLRPLPPEVVGAAGDRTLVKLDVEVAHEFASLRHVFVQTVVSVDDLKLKWHETHRAVMQAHGEAVEVALQSWWSGGGSIDLCHRLRAALFVAGVPAGEANQLGRDMGLQAEHLINTREDALCGGRRSEEAEAVAMH